MNTENFLGMDPLLKNLKEGTRVASNRTALMMLKKQKMKNKPTTADLEQIKKMNQVKQMAAKNNKLIKK